MRVIINICKHDPANVEKIDLEDVASYEVTDNQIKVRFNGSPDEVFPIVNDLGHTKGEWFYLDISSTQIGLKVDMNK